MSRIRHYAVKLVGAIKTVVCDTAYSLSGQSNQYAILQTAHRIEKGLTIQNPRKLWGWNKIDSLVKKISREMNSETQDSFAVDTGLSVVKAYVKQKTESGDRDEYERARNLLMNLPEVLSKMESVNVPGGAHLVSAPTLNGGTDSVEEFFRSRHSIRDFDQKEIDKEILEKAVSLANTCPSACNRQMSKVYCIDGKARAKLGFDNTYNADKYLIITSDMKAFTKGEFGDWTVSTSIFAAFLVLALHGLGIGSCVLRKDMFFGSEYNNAIRKTCRIPGNEKIILELAIGYYKDVNCVAYSNRKDADSIITWVC